MKHNRVFQRRGYRITALRLSLTDVSRTARQWGFPFALRIHPEILSRYTLPHICDDEGYYLVGRVALLVDAVLQGRLPRRLVSHGRYLGFRLKLTAQHRRSDSAELLELEVLVGPCAGRRQGVYVWRVEPLC